jgi:hypothetical protein
VESDTHDSPDESSLDRESDGHQFQAAACVAPLRTSPDRDDLVQMVTSEVQLKNATEFIEVTECEESRSTLMQC